ncbi:hypothetical protein BJY52DRAFT_1194491 [Lactarius psammicola]|nr:hypothetical protein BJY52DRAFT_1194491 [Lactarius psammicola]
MPQSPINLDNLNEHLAASINDGIEVFDAIQSTPTTWEPTPLVGLDLMEKQGTPIASNTGNVTSNDQDDIVDQDSCMASPVQYNDNDDKERDSSEPVCLGVKFPIKGYNFQKNLKQSTSEPAPLLVLLKREAKGGITLGAQLGLISLMSRAVPKNWPISGRLSQFLLTSQNSLIWRWKVKASDEVYGVGYSAGQKEDLAAMIQDLREEIGHDLRAGSSIPANIQDFNDSMGMVLSTLDAGLDDDLPTKGVTPSSWFRLSAALLAAMTRGVLRSGGPKVKGRVKLVPDEDHFRVAPGLGMPTTEGGCIVLMARHLTELFEQHKKGDNLPFVDYFNNLQKVTQKHIQRAVKLAAVEAYQESTGDTEKIREIVMDDMAEQLINQLKDDPVVQAEVKRKVQEQMMRKLEDECIEDIDEWRTMYRKGLVAALRAEATGTDIPVLSHSQIVRECSEEIQAQADKKAAEIKDSIIKEEVEKYLLLQETDNARAIIRAEITSEKKNWAVVYRDSVQLTFLSEKATLLGYHLVRNNNDKEREGHTAKRAIPDGKRFRLDGSITPQAKKNKKKNGGRKLIILKPFSTAGSKASSNEDGMEEDPLPPPDFGGISSPVSAPVSEPIQPISVPVNVRALQQPSGPLHNPMTLPVIHSNISLDPLRGVASSMHNPKNVMEEDPKINEATALVAKPAAPITVLPDLPAIPLLPGLAELLNALQTNITMAFSSQISSLTDRMDQQDIRITNITKSIISKGKGVAKARETPPHLPTTTAPGVRPDAVAHIPSTSAPGGTPDATAAANPAPREPMGPPLGPLPMNAPSISAWKNGPVPVPRNVTRWASVVTSTMYAGQTTARAGAITNTSAVGRTVTGGKKAGGTPAYLINTEITVMRGKGLKDPKKEEAVRSLTPTQIVQSVRSQMEKLMASPPMLMCGRWSTKPGSLNFVYVFSGSVPFNIISQYRKEVIFPDSMASISDTFDTFRSLAAKVSDENSHDDFNRALCKLEQEWGFNTAELDVKDTIAREVMKDTHNGITQIQEALKAFEDKWLGFSPMKYLMSTLKNKRFASKDKIKLFNEQRKSAGDKAREVQDAVVFMGNLAASLYENNEVNCKILSEEAETLVILHDLHIQLSNGVGVSPRAATVIKEYLKHLLALFNVTKTHEAHA